MLVMVKSSSLVLLSVRKQSITCKVGSVWVRAHSIAPCNLRKVNKMARWQFEPRIGHTLDLEKARRCALDLNPASKPLRVHPVMKGPDKITRGPNKGDERFWTGTNQPQTVSFSATDKGAKEVREAYGRELVFVRDRKSYYGL